MFILKHSQVAEWQTHLNALRIVPVKWSLKQYRFESGPDYAETQHNDVVAVEIRRETLRAHSVVYGEHILNKY